MAEALTLTTPATRTTTTYRVAQLHLEPDDRRFTLVVRGTNGETITAYREGTDAVTLMRALNKANNTIKSLERRALEWLAAQPEGAAIPGTISGAPD